MYSNINPEISIILPCRNEEKALGFCLKQIKETIKKYNLSAEIIVSDSSVDKSPEIALRFGQGKQKTRVILVKHNKEGYGNAYLEAFKIAKGKYIFMADADATYDFSEIPNFINQLKKNSELVIGNRFGKEIEKGAMQWKNQYIGTPILSLFLKIFFGAKIKDSQSGMRAIKKDLLEKLNLQTTGMEFASEMIVKAIKNKLKITEIPVNYYKRKGESKLKPFSDAYRHIRFMLLYSPLFLFFIPGLVLFLLGFISMFWLCVASSEIFGIKLFYHPVFFSSLLIIIGYQLIIFSGFAKIYSITHLNEKNAIFEKLFKYITIERASIFGFFIMILAIGLFSFVVGKWINSGFNSIDEIKSMIFALTMMIIGVQTIFSSFMLSILSIKEK